MVSCLIYQALCQKNKNIHAVFASYWLGLDICGVVVILIASIASVLIFKECHCF